VKPQVRNCRWRRASLSKRWVVQLTSAIPAARNSQKRKQTNKQTQLGQCTQQTTKKHLHDKRAPGAAHTTRPNQAAPFFFEFFWNLDLNDALLSFLNRLLHLLVILTTHVTRLGVRE